MESCSSLVIAVDLTPLRPGGTNGGIKPAIFSMLAEIGRQPEPLLFVYLTNSATHGEVRALARVRDLLVCVLVEKDFPIALKNTGSSEFLLSSPPENFVQSLGVDVLYCPFGACTYHAPGVPTVALIADLLHRDYPFTLTSAQIAEREAFIGRTLEVASMIQCISRSGVERMIANYRVPEEKLFYTYLPVQLRLDADPEPPQDFVRKRGIKAPFFFYPANLWKHKNHGTLLLAYRLYREHAGEEAWDMVLTFHEDKKGGALRELAEALGIAPHLHCPGYVSAIDLRALWQSAGALVFPSLHEGFGIPLVEAMHYGVPIITGEDFSLKEIGGDACYRMESRNVESIAEALLKISQDAALRESLSRRGKQRLKFYDLKIETRKLLDVWRDLPPRSGDFPRKPLVLEQPCAVAVPTPASDALWRVEVRVNPKFPQNRYSVYLDAAAYGSFSCPREKEPQFFFQCRPRSRTLRVVVSRDQIFSGDENAVTEVAVEEIVARTQEGERFGLFQARKGGFL